MQIWAHCSFRLRFATHLLIKCTAHNLLIFMIALINLFIYLELQDTNGDPYVRIIFQSFTYSSKPDQEVGITWVGTPTN